MTINQYFDSELSKTFFLSCITLHSTSERLVDNCCYTAENDFGETRAFCRRRLPCARRAVIDINNHLKTITAVKQRSALSTKSC